MDKDLAEKVADVAQRVVASGAISANGHGNVSVRVPGEEVMYRPAGPSRRGDPAWAVVRVGLDGALELPQRDLGGQQPDWPDLLAQAEWARDRGAAVHLDGARLWESAAGYGKPLDEIAALFDSVYVSFYKGIGALAGCCVAGSSDILAEVRGWRRPVGRTGVRAWPQGPPRPAVPRH